MINFIIPIELQLLSLLETKLVYVHDILYVFYRWDDDMKIGNTSIINCYTAHLNCPKPHVYDPHYEKKLLQK